MLFVKILYNVSFAIFVLPSTNCTFQLMKEREAALHDSNDAIPGSRYGGNRPRGAKAGTAAQRKQAAAERIGATGTHRR